VKDLAALPLIDLLGSRGNTGHVSPLHSQDSHWVLLKGGSNPPVVDREVMALFDYNDQQSYELVKGTILQTSGSN